MKNIKIKYCDTLNLDNEQNEKFVCTNSEDNRKWFFYYIESKKLIIYEYSEGSLA